MCWEIPAAADVAPGRPMGADGGCRPCHLGRCSRLSDRRGNRPFPAVICQPITEDEVSRLFDRWNASSEQRKPRSSRCQ
jgi:hypothetical protein